MATHIKGILNSRPKAQRNLGSDVTGLREMGLETERDGFLYVPKSFVPKSPSPLLVMFHGAGGTARQSIDAMKAFADKTKTILVAPQSQGSTWDNILGGFNQDIELLDEALSDVFALYPIDPDHVAIGGVSDGASYALSVGAKNSDLFTHILAFSPTLAADEIQSDDPRIFVSQGSGDTVTPEIAQRAFDWFLGNEGADAKFARARSKQTAPDAN